MSTTTIQALLGDLDTRLTALPPEHAHLGTFLGTYRRTTAAIGTAVAGGRFEDPAWVVRWTDVFGRYYTDAHDRHLAGDPVPRPWRIAFGLAADVHPLGHLLVGISTHINYDLPQAMLDVISADDFADPRLLAGRVRDHDRVDGVLAARVAAEDTALGGARRLVDRVLTPANRWASRRFLAESRHKVWENVLALQEARGAGPEAYRGRLAELEVLAAAKAVDVLTPGLVLPRLALAGFGVRLPPA
ncbi:hypothetical protein SAMN04488543_2572 [Friedmanniella luteola]|uniref:Uncharacterized protein n=1 Tax=Friedmanniella luteola TaxID=546871 RepID=A0A1H1VTA6_9ACTN|nr:DUF5995 family protein [Friedmanniella luteola]SDS88174.1 hypothetical protein SAMN04488543_2572 [Friedmanniella luteola]